MAPARWQASRHRLAPPLGRRAWQLLAGVLVFEVGTGMTLPLVIVHLHAQRSGRPCSAGRDAALAQPAGDRQRARARAGARSLRRHLQPVLADGTMIGPAVAGIALGAGLGAGLLAGLALACGLAAPAAAGFERMLPPAANGRFVPRERRAGSLLTGTRS